MMRFAGIVLTLVLGGCVAPLRAVVTDVDSRAWSEPAQLAFRNEDTLGLNDIHFFLRYNDRFTADTLSVEIVLLSPDSLRGSERFTLRIARTEGPASLLRETEVPYRRRVCFPRRGLYRMSIVPTRTVRGIEAVGIHLTKSE